LAVVPLVVTNLIGHKPVPLYGDGGNVRGWIHVDDHWQPETNGDEWYCLAALLNSDDDPSRDRKGDMW
jgi:nucleoside-diphosphate-sugar epimerase